VRDFRNLIAWQKSHAATLRVYEVTSGFPPEERFGLASQLRRCAASIPSNIAEGAGRIAVKEYRHFLSIAAGSASELQYQLELARDLGYIADEAPAMIEASHEIKRLIWALHRTTK
jgi:four helix bundle protein